MQLTAEASDIPTSFGLFAPVGKSDGRYGFRLKSHKTGKTIQMEVYKVDRSEDEIAGWNLRPTEFECRSNVRLRNFRVLVIND